MSRSCRACFVAASLLTACGSLSAADDWAGPAAEFLKKHCNSCHSGDAPEADLRLDQLGTDLKQRQTFLRWVQVFDKVARQEMPPADEPQPTTAERDALSKALTGPLAAADLARQQQEGRTVLRRLNRVEYENTLRDLLDLPLLEVKDGIPSDSESDGFDTVGAALTMSYVQQDAYLKAAETALERAITLYPKPQERTFQFGFADPPPPRPGREYPPRPSYDMALLSNSNLDPPTYMRNNQGGLFVARGDGMYKLRFEARGAMYDSREIGGGREGKITDADRPHVILLYAELPPFSRWIATFDLPRDRMGLIEFTTRLNAGEKIRRIHASTHDSGQTYRPTELPFFGPVIGMRSFAAIGPIIDQWPPASHRRVLGDVPLVDLPKAELPKPNFYGTPQATMKLAPQDPPADAARLIADFVPRAFRRQTPASEIDRYTKIAQQCLSEGLPFQDSLFAAYQAALCSPDFLYFQEQPGKLDGEAIANRLSYFLWRSLPDEQLQRLGRAGKLLEPQVLHDEVERLLADPRCERFVNDFTDQWLRLREINATMADQDLYPEYHEDFELLDSLLRETRAYFAEMLKHDLGVEYVVDSDFVFINRALASLYGIPGVEGTDIRKVQLPPGHVRGGLLTQASVLKVTANGTSTSPVTRGVWTMDRILGSPPPPPPAEVPAIEADLSGEKTIRAQLAKHRNVAGCASCHKKIDPPGFALECFDILGGYRDQYRGIGGKPIVKEFRRVKVKYNFGQTVDASGETADGKPFADVREFKKILLTGKPQLARNLIERLVTYSTGAPVQFGDRADVDLIVAKLEKENYGLRAMIHAVVQSRMFLSK